MKTEGYTTQPEIKIEGSYPCRARPLRSFTIALCIRTTMGGD